MNVNPVSGGTQVYKSTSDTKAADSKTEVQQDTLAEDTVTISDEAQVQIGTDPFDPKKKEN